jgi:hypothetical protein
MPAIKHPKLRQLHDYWDGKRAGRRMPSRADIDPLDMVFVIGNLILIDVLPGEKPGFRIRLHGTKLVERVRYELTGKMLDDMPEVEFRELSRASFTKVVRTREPLHVHRNRILDGRPRQYESLILPLSVDDTAVDMMICGLIYDGDR